MKRAEVYNLHFKLIGKNEEGFQRGEKIFLRKGGVKRETPVSVNNEHILNQGLNKT